MIGGWWRNRGRRADGGCQYQQSLELDGRLSKGEREFFTACRSFVKCIMG